MFHSLSPRLRSLALTLALALSLGLRSPRAQTPPTQTPPTQTPRGATLTLSPGFLPDPQRVSGTTAGETDAASLSPNCSGFVSRSPDHILVLRGPEPWLRVFVSSSLDTTLALQRPDGTWMCNDDAFGRNPALEGVFPAGRYALHVGSYHLGVRAPYALSVTELRAVRP